MIITKLVIIFSDNKTRILGEKLWVSVLNNVWRLEKGVQIYEISIFNEKTRKNKLDIMNMGYQNNYIFSTFDVLEEIRNMLNSLTM
jgi:hypothetical protein